MASCSLISRRVCGTLMPWARSVSASPATCSANREWNIRSSTSQTRSSDSRPRFVLVDFQAPTSPSAVPCRSRSASEYGRTRRLRRVDRLRGSTTPFSVYRRETSVCRIRPQ
ncbi:hypothetical protein [Actinoplanes sp. NPDC023714]|uniref:hypothetical protein n=1 Tax=Actinoplanes sp. NPDC023714 TaxID=3154322 RepID=UPI0033DA2AED